MLPLIPATSYDNQLIYVFMFMSAVLYVTPERTIQDEQKYRLRTERRWDI